MEKGVLMQIGELARKVLRDFPPPTPKGIGHASRHENKVFTFTSCLAMVIAGNYLEKESTCQLHMDVSLAMCADRASEQVQQLAVRQVGVQGTSGIGHGDILG